MSTTIHMVASEKLQTGLRRDLQPNTRALCGEIVPVGRTHPTIAAWDDPKLCRACLDRHQASCHKGVGRHGSRVPVTCFLVEDGMALECLRAILRLPTAADRARLARAFDAIAIREKDDDHVAR